MLHNDIIEEINASVTTKVFPCNITVNVICRPLVSHCYGNIFVEQVLTH